MDVRPVLTASEQTLASVEARDADLTAALGQLATWDRQGLRVPRVVIGIAEAPDPGRVESELSGFGIAGGRLAIALPEGSVDAAGMREALAAIRSRTGAVAIVANFGSGAHPDVEFLVDYPADALALSPRIAAGVAERADVAARVKETCAVTAELGWRVIAADVASPAEREALAAAGVAEVTGPGIAPFTPPAELSELLARLKVAVPAEPEPSGRPAAPAPAPSPPAAPAAKAEATRESAATPVAVAPETPAAPDGQRSKFSHDAPPERPEPRLARPAASKPAATSIGPAPAPPRRGSPGRSQPPRGERLPRERGHRVVMALVLLIILAAIAYVVLAYLGQVPDPLGIEDLEIKGI